MTIVPGISDTAFAINVTTLLLPIPVMARIPRCLVATLFMLILTQTSFCLSNVPTLNHSSFVGLKILSNSLGFASKTSVPGRGGISGSIVWHFFNSSRRPKILTFAL
jgi:hypothetical protein